MKPSCQPLTLPALQSRFLHPQWTLCQVPVRTRRPFEQNKVPQPCPQPYLPALLQALPGHQTCLPAPLALFALPGPQAHLPYHQRSTPNEPSQPNRPPSPFPSPPRPHRTPNLRASSPRPLRHRRTPRPPPLPLNEARTRFVRVLHPASPALIPGPQARLPYPSPVQRRPNDLYPCPAAHSPAQQCPALFALPGPQAHLPCHQQSTLNEPSQPNRPPSPLPSPPRPHRTPNLRASSPRPLRHRRTPRPPPLPLNEARAQFARVLHPASPTLIPGPQACLPYPSPAQRRPNDLYPCPVARSPAQQCPLPSGPLSCPMAPSWPLSWPTDPLSWPMTPSPAQRFPSWPLFCPTRPPLLVNDLSIVQGFHRYSTHLGLIVHLYIAYLKVCDQCIHVTFYLN